MDCDLAIGKMVSRMPPVQSLQFIWDRHFVKGESGDCVPSCVSMAASYWKDKMPELPIPADAFHKDL